MFVKVANFEEGPQLPTFTKKDLRCVPAGELKIRTKNDLDYLSSIAEDRTQWRRLSANIERQPRRPSKKRQGCEWRYIVRSRSSSGY